jgi:hypothetical protein
MDRRGGIVLIPIRQGGGKWPEDAPPLEASLGIQ